MVTAPATDDSPDWLDGDPAQAKVLEMFLNQMRGSWVWLARNVGEVVGHSVGQYSALLTAERAERAGSDPGWDVHHGAGMPGFTQYYGASPEVVYERNGRDGAEVMVYDRTWHGVRPDGVELAEDFRLFFNLWEDRPTRTYFDFDESGNSSKAVEITTEGVRVRTDLVRRYQAARQLWLALYLDSTNRSTDLDNQEHRWEMQRGGLAIDYYRGCTTPGEKPFSRLLGKRLFAPPPLESCGVWPFEAETQYEDFLIGTTETGEPVVFTSNPDELANYFGANSGNPHYLTPVYFRREVLNKYYADTDRFTVQDGYLRCTGLWGLRLDNDQAGHIMVFLGDLGRDIPHAEAQYWRSFNILPPEEGPSETLVRRAFGGQFAEPKSLDLRFPTVYRRTNKSWADAFGAPLFRDLHADDRHILSKLHVPITDSAAEFDEQILYLAKLLVDSLNEPMLTERVGKGKNGEQGLGKLERFLAAVGAKDAHALVTPLARIQGLRSRGAAHRKGSSYDIATAVGEAGRQKGFGKLLGEAIGTLEALQELAAAQPN